MESWNVTVKIFSHNGNPVSGQKILKQRQLSVYALFTLVVEMAFTKAVGLVFKTALMASIQSPG